MCVIVAVYIVRQTGKLVIEQLNYLVTKWVEPRTCNGISDVDHRIGLKLKRQMKRIDMEVKYYE